MTFKGRTVKRFVSAAISVAILAPMLSAQAAYQPKFKGDPARSDSEAAALGYLRTFLRAQKIYKKKNGHYATTLMELSKTGSFTRRMASSTDRGDYTVKFRPHKEKTPSKAPCCQSSRPQQNARYSRRSKG